MAAKKTSGASASKSRSTNQNGKKTARSTAAKTQAGRKKTTSSQTKRNTKSQPKAAPAKAREPEYMDYALYLEIIVLVMLAFAILVVISLLGMGGAFGKAISSFCFGTFGVMAWPLPFALFFGISFLISNSGSRISRIKTYGVTGLFIVICAFMQMVLVGTDAEFSVREYYEAGVQFKTGGGVVGGVLAGILTAAIGKVGAFLLLIVLLMILLIIVTQKSFLKTIRKHSAGVLAHAGQTRERRREWQRNREERASYREEEPEDDEPVDVLGPDSFSILPKEPRMRRKVSGMTNDTRIGVAAGKKKPYRSGEAEEIIAPLSAGTLGKSTLSKGSIHLGKAAESTGDSFALPAAKPLASIASEAVSAADKNAEAAPARRKRLVPEIRLEAEDESDENVIINPEPSAMSMLRTEKENAVAKQAFSFTITQSPYMNGDDSSDEEEAAAEEIRQEPVREAAQDVEEIFAQEQYEDDDEDAYAASYEDEDEADVYEPAAEPVRTAVTATQAVKAAPSAAAAQTVKAEPSELAKEYEENDADVSDEDERREKHHKAPKQSAEEIEQGVMSVQQEIEAIAPPEPPVYHFPPLSLLSKPSGTKGQMTQDQLYETAQKLSEVFQTFGVDVKITNVTCGPSVTRYELTPALGVKVQKITSLRDDIMLNLAAADIRIEAPIPGKSAVGIEVPNKVVTGVLLRELLESDEFRNHPSKLAYGVGIDIGGSTIVSDIAKMPHLLIAGATGSGKSVFINTMIMSILFKATPEEVKLILIDPKVVELSVYNGIPHLYIPVVTNPKKASDALNWAVVEMNNRYQLFSDAQVRDIKSYNKKIDSLGDVPDKPQKMPQIVIIVDELADLMMVASGDVQDAIMHLTQLARAAGIHLVIATQRPSVDVITGVIKSNLPSRIAFMVSSGVDSRTILDMNGAENLLGNGDMLFAPQNLKQPVRVQGAFISDEEVAAIVDYLKENNSADYSAAQAKRLESVEKTSASVAGGGEGDVDELFADAGKFLIDKDKASIGMLQRRFKIGFNRAARIMDQLYDAGLVGPEEGTKPRKIIMSEEQFENYLEQN